MSNVHKNNNNALGNYCIYVIRIFKKIFKFGKADFDRITKSTGIPTRIHQQMRKLIAEYGKYNVTYELIIVKLNVTTAQAKELEQLYLNNYIDEFNEIPEGNIKSHKNKNK